MEFEVPQFIEVEDKVIGPLTLKQFLFLAGGGALLFILWFPLRLPFFIIASIIIVPITLILTFKKVKGKSMPGFINAWIKYHLKPKLYLWRKK